MQTSPVKIAVVGAGPAGLYCVGHLLERCPGVAIDVFERLPSPHGLVRYGVAPDQTDKKRITDQLFDVYLSHPQVRFFGNLSIGEALDHDTLSRHYTAVIYAVGAAADKSLAIPGEALPGSWSAREFVAWYNGHPDYSSLEFDLSGERAVIIGNGNVALDAARMLVSPLDDLRRTDIADYALEALAASRIREVQILGRRSHLHSAFHNAELEELAAQTGNRLAVDLGAAAVAGDAPGRLGWSQRRKADAVAALPRYDGPGSGAKVVFRFLASPLEILGDAAVSGIRIGCNGPEASGRADSPAGGTPAVETLDCGLVLRSIGYRGTAIPGLPFDDRAGVIPQSGGRVPGDDGTTTGAYVCGWIKRGPQGVIGSNKKCARETIDTLLGDLAAGALPGGERIGRDIEILLRERGLSFVSKFQWKRIDQVERLHGVAEQRPRKKLTQWGQLLDAAGAPSMHSRGPIQ